VKLSEEAQEDESAIWSRRNAQNPPTKRKCKEAEARDGRRMWARNAIQRGGKATQRERRG